MNNALYDSAAVADYIVTQDVNFTARYVPAAKAIVVFDYNGGKDADDKGYQVLCGEPGTEFTVQDPGALTRTGYDFAGWSEEEIERIWNCRHHNNL